MRHTALVKFGLCADPWWPDLWPDLLLSVTSNSIMCTSQLTSYRCFSTKCVLLGVIAHTLEDPWTVKHFIFDLTFDVIGELEVNEIRLPSTYLRGLSNAVCILRIRPVVSEIRGWGQKDAPHRAEGGREAHRPPPSGLTMSAGSELGLHHLCCKMSNFSIPPRLIDALHKKSEICNMWVLGVCYFVTF